MEATPGLPPRQGLYDPSHEHDACGVGFVAHIKGRKSHDIVEKGLTILNNLTHRGATGADPLHGDGAGVLIQIPDAFFREVMAKQGVKLPKAGAYGVGIAALTLAAFVADHVPAIDPIDTPCGKSALMIDPAGVTNSIWRCSPPSAHGMS